MTSTSASSSCQGEKETNPLMLHCRSQIPFRFHKTANSVGAHRLLPRLATSPRENDDDDGNGADGGGAAFVIGDDGDDIGFVAVAVVPLVNSSAAEAAGRRRQFARAAARLLTDAQTKTQLRCRQVA